MSNLLTVQDLIDFVRGAVGDQSNIYLTNANILSWAQVGYEMLEDEVGGSNYYSNFLYTTSFLGDTGTLAGGDQTFSVGNPESDHNVVGLESLLINGRAITYREKEDVASSNPGADFDNDTATIPSYYWMEQRPSNHLGLYQTIIFVSVYPRPTNDVTWEAKLKSWGSRLFSGGLSDQLVEYMPPQYIRRVALYCVYRARVQEKDYRGADLALMEFNAQLNTLRAVLDRPYDSTPTMIGDPYDRI